MSLTEAVVARLPASISRHFDVGSIGLRLARASFWTLTGAVAAQLLSTPAAIILARLMGPGHYGELGMINSSVDLFTVFAGFGLGLTATKHVAEFRKKDPVRAGRILVLSTLTGAFTGTFFAALLFFLAPLLAAKTLAAPQLSGPLRICAVLLFFTAMNSAQNGGLYGFEAFKTMARLQSVVSLVYCPLVIGGYLLAGLEGTLWGMVASKIVDWFLKGWALRSEARRAGVPLLFANDHVWRRRRDRAEGRHARVRERPFGRAVGQGHSCVDVGCHRAQFQRPEGYWRRPCGRRRDQAPAIFSPPRR